MAAASTITVTTEQSTNNRTEALLAAVKPHLGGQSSQKTYPSLLRKYDVHTALREPFVFAAMLKEQGLSQEQGENVFKALRAVAKAAIANQLLAETDVHAVVLSGSYKRQVLRGVFEPDATSNSSTMIDQEQGQEQMDAQTGASTCKNIDVDRCHDLDLDLGIDIDQAEDEYEDEEEGAGCVDDDAAIERTEPAAGVELLSWLSGLLRERDSAFLERERMFMERERAILDLVRAALSRV